MIQRPLPIRECMNKPVVMTLSTGWLRCIEYTGLHLILLRVHQVFDSNHRQVLAVPKQGLYMCPRGAIWVALTWGHSLPMKTVKSQMSGVLIERYQLFLPFQPHSSAEVK